MELLLSGANHPNAEQRDVSKSIGGYISSTRVPNGRLNSIFDDIGCYEQQKKTQTTLAFFLVNNTGATITDLELRQIPQVRLGNDVAQADFLWSAVVPKDNNLIEKMGNMYELPFNADFVQPDCRREDAILKIISAGVIGDSCSILGVQFILTGNTKESLVADIIQAFDNNADYSVEYKSDNEVYFQRKELISSGAQISLTTSGGAQAQTVNFANFKDDGVLLVNSLSPGQAIGLWISRRVKTNKDVSCFDIEKIFDEEFGKDFHENSLEIHGENEEILEVIFSYK